MADEQAQNDTPSRQSGGGVRGGCPHWSSRRSAIRPAPKIGDSRPAPQGNGGNSDQGSQNRRTAAMAAEPGGDGQPKKSTPAVAVVVAVAARWRRHQNGQNQNNWVARRAGWPSDKFVEAITSGDAVELDERR